MFHNCLVACSLLARILGACLTIHSPPAFFVVVAVVVGCFFFVNGE